MHRLLAIIASLLPLAATHAGAIPAAADEGDLELVQLIQQLLIDRGYPIGQSDGVADKRTRAAISAFETSLGRPATGEPSQELYELLFEAGLAVPISASPFSFELEIDGVARPTADLSPAGVGTGARRDTAAPPAPAAGSLVGTQWRIVDSTGASFQFTLERDGRVSGTAFDRFWRWRRFGASLQITFDNEFGGTVLREGELTGNRSIAGVAQSSDGRFWDWTAVLQNRRE